MIQNIIKKLSFNSIYYYSAIFFALTLPLSRASISFFIFWFLLLFLLEGQYIESFRKMASFQPLKIMGLFISFLVLSMMWTTNIPEALHTLRLYGYWILIPIMAVKLEKKWLWNIMKAFLIGMFISEILSLGMYFDLWSINGHTSTLPIPFMNRIHYSVFLAITATILLNRLLEAVNDSSSKFLISLFLGLTIFNLIISDGRTGMIALIISSTIAIIFHYQKNIRKIIMLIGFMLLSIGLIYIFIPQFKIRVLDTQQNIQKAFEGDLHSSWGARIAFWVMTYDVVKKSPLIGVGIGDYRDEAKEIFTVNPHNLQSEVITWCSSTHFHNQYLTIIVQSGLFGLFLMIWMIKSFYQLPIQDKKTQELSISMITIFIISMFTEPMWYMQFPLILFVFITTFSLIVSKSELIETKN